MTKMTKLVFMLAMLGTSPAAAQYLDPMRDYNNAVRDMLRDSERHEMEQRQRDLETRQLQLEWQQQEQQIDMENRLRDQEFRHNYGRRY
jgi:hypothetical protein